jgi:hypothetical protein
MSEYNFDQEPADNVEDIVAEITEDSFQAIELDLPEEVVELEQAVPGNGAIMSPEPRAPKKTKVNSLDNDVIGSSKASTSTKKKQIAEQPLPENKVAIFSTKNVTWSGVGKVYRGYNIVSADAAEKWATRTHIRIATPEEVAREYGV